MSQLGHVVDIHDGKAVISFQEHPTCQACGKCKGLDFGLVKRDGSKTMEIENSLDLSPGECVEVDMDEGILVLAALLTYMFPVFAMITGYFAAQALAGLAVDVRPGEGAGIVGSLVFLAASVYLIKSLNPWFDRISRKRVRVKRSLFENVR